ncbi:MAG: hypothetical protein EOP46_03345 [Sphingobacteriaceae bacterium]|nr:MAG: hypothetical protein EOP46_03345 [Sphingobacteriaceae bacterium]
MLRLRYVFSYILGFCALFSGNANSKPFTKPDSGKYDIAVYYFPNWGPFETSEWKRLSKAKPMFKGHQQPKVPLWGYENENNPEVMARKIDAATAYGVNTFIFDWYYNDAGKYLSEALEKGFLKAKNANKMKFSLLWCNHDLGKEKGAVKPETFEKITDYVIEHYFKQPNYWKINGAPYFSIYQFDTFLETFGNDTTKAFAALDRFRTKVKNAGFPDLHLNGVLWGLRGANRDKTINTLGINSTTSYVWIHHIALPNFPASNYNTIGNAYFKSIENGGAVNGLETSVNSTVPYHPNVSMGWDSSPRCANATPEYWNQHQTPYPYGAVIENNTPANFKAALLKAKAYVEQKPRSERIIVINSWNEWGEGSYLEPDTKNKMAYLEALRDVFVSK